MLPVCCVAFVFALWNARDQYFIWDEWMYWTVRHPLLHDGALVEFFCRPHAGHWPAIIMAIWWPLDRLFGLHTYLPYVLPTVIGHCFAGGLLYELLCYVGLCPAVAVGIATVYLFLAAAAGNVSYGWQICFVAPIACCYLALLTIQQYADSGRRVLAWVSVLVMLLAVVSSGVGLTMLAVAVATALARRCVGLAAVLGLIPGGIYVLWRWSYRSVLVPMPWPALGIWVRYWATGLESTFGSLVQVRVPAVSWLLLVTVTGAAIGAFVRGDRYWSVFAATLGGAFLFYASLATQRWSSDPKSFGAAADRYVHVASALVLPSVALLVDRGVRGHKVLIGAALVIGVWIVTMNARAFVRVNDTAVLFSQRVRTEVAATVALGLRTARVPGTLTPYGPATLGLTIDVMRHLAAEKKLPCDANWNEAVAMATKLGVFPAQGPISCAGR